MRRFTTFISNEIFALHSWYFRNALVRANYSNMPGDVFAAGQNIEAFFRNLILGERNGLKNRNLYVLTESQSAAGNVQKSGYW